MGATCACETSQPDQEVDETTAPTAGEPCTTVGESDRPQAAEAATAVVDRDTVFANHAGKQGVFPGVDAVMGRLHAVVGKLDRNADGMLAAIEIVKVCGPTEATAIAGCGAVPGESAGLLSRGVI